MTVLLLLPLAPVGVIVAILTGLIARGRLIVEPSRAAALSRSAWSAVAIAAVSALACWVVLVADTFVSGQIEGVGRGWVQHWIFALCLTAFEIVVGVSALLGTFRQASPREADVAAPGISWRLLVGSAALPVVLIAICTVLLRQGCHRLGPEFAGLPRLVCGPGRWVPPPVPWTGALPWAVGLVLCGLAWWRREKRPGAVSWLACRTILAAFAFATEFAVATWVLDMLAVAAVPEMRGNPVVEHWPVMAATGAVAVLVGTVAVGRLLVPPRLDIGTLPMPGPDDAGTRTSAPAL